MTITEGEDWSWPQLLSLIEERQVVPVVGQGLLQVQVGKRSVPLCRHLARRVAERLELEGDFETCSLSDVAERYEDVVGKGHLERIHKTLWQVYDEECGHVRIPDSLLALARIRPLQLFLSTTFDDLLSRSINRERFDGRPGTHVLEYYPGAGARADEEASTLPGGLDNPKDPVVFHLMGRLSPTPFQCVITEEDALEWIVSLQHDTQKPNRLFKALELKGLLLIGNDFPDWLAWFFLRTTLQERLTKKSPRAHVLAEPCLTQNAHAVSFLHHFGPPSRLVYTEGGPIDFVKELYRRYTASRPSAIPSTPDEGLVDEHPVFLSYAHEDKASVERIAQALETRGVAVWWDKELQGGDRWSDDIERKIREASFFVPVLSKHTLARWDGYCRTEWFKAYLGTRQGSLDLPFLVPVALEDLSEADQSQLPSDFREAHWITLPGREPTPEFVGRMQDLYREYNKRVTTGAAL